MQERAPPLGYTGRVGVVILPAYESPLPNYFGGGLKETPCVAHLCVPVKLIQVSLTPR